MEGGKSFPLNHISQANLHLVALHYLRHRSVTQDVWTNALGLSHLKGVERPVYLWNSVWYASVRVTLGARVASDCREKVEDLCVAETLSVRRAFQLRLLTGCLAA